MVRTLEKMILGILIIAIFGISSAVIAGLGDDRSLEMQADSNNVQQISLEQAKVIAFDLGDGTITEAFLTTENGVLIYEIEIVNGDLETEVRIDAQGGQVLMIENGNNRAGQEGSEEESYEEIDIPITGSALEKASSVALKYIGEGKVTDTEIGDEEGYYEIEITLDNGREVDVHLDENFNVLSQEWEDGDEDE